MTGEAKASPRCHSEERSDVGIRFPLVSLLVTAVEEKAAAVATGSGSEATAESCGGTVLLMDNGTRERRLRGRHETNLRQGVAR